MAELPRYRPLGLAIPSVPTVDFTMAGRARARAGDAVAKGLDAMGDYVYKRQVAQTKREAIKYSFENPVTSQQIEDAMSQGRDIEEIIGDPDTVFGSITTATAAQQLTTELETVANSRIADYSARVKAGLLVSDEDISSMRSDLAAMISGHSDVIASVSPEQALKYNAAANTTASTLYKSALEQQLSVKRLAKIAVADQYLTNKLPGLIRDELTKKDADPKKAIDAAASLITQAQNLVINTGDLAYAKTKVAEIPGIARQVYTGVLSDHVMNLPDDKRLSALRSNNYGKFNLLFGQLSSQEQAQVRSDIRAEITARQQADDRIDADNLQSAQQKLVVHIENYASSLSGSEPSISALNAIRDIAIETNGKAIDAQGIISLMKTVRDLERDEEPNPVGEAQVLNLIYEDKITTWEDLQNAAADYGLGPKATLGLLSKMNAATKEVERGVAAEARQHAQIVPGTIGVAKKKAQAFSSFIARVDKMFIEKMADWESQAEPDITKKPSKVTVAKELRKEIMASDYGKRVTSLLEATNERLARFGLPEITEYTTYADIAADFRAAGVDEDTAKFVKKKMQAIERFTNLRDELM